MKLKYSSFYWNQDDWVTKCYPGNPDRRLTDPLADSTKQLNMNN